ncbi:MAG: glycosyltransferase family 4 protein [Bacteroidales bacterium]|nr:glycosyltransferase family 4 protein [Bacteroidales bacterium]
MRVLMFGWEFPPHISGGLGTACQGIVNALGQRGDLSIIFVVPKVFGDEKAENTIFAGANKYVKTHKQILNRNIRIVVPQPPTEKIIETVTHHSYTTLSEATDKLVYIETASMLHPYIQAEQIEKILIRKRINPETVRFDEYGRLVTFEEGEPKVIDISFEEISEEEVTEEFEFTGKYTANLFTETGMYARVCEQLSKQYQFDVIHAHDWLTYEAGIAAKKATGKPLVIHVHATEYDRSGKNVNQTIFNIEKDGMENADAIITVSNLTRDIVIKKYKISPEKVFTIYNAVDFKPNRKKYIKPENEKLVTFLGRITYQKGPEYFIEAAYKVLQRVKNVRFVMAGNGDMYKRMILMAAKLGISDRFHFTDFLKHDEVKHLFAVSDVYVMPSVSEPFGISPLEAVKSNVPVIISKQSGVAEILKHAIKVDYWDVDAIADAIYGLIKYPALSNFFVRKGKNEVKQLKWDNCANEIVKVYNKIVE